MSILSSNNADLRGPYYRKIGIPDVAERIFLCGMPMQLVYYRIKTNNRWNLSYRMLAFEVLTLKNYSHEKQIKIIEDMLWEKAKEITHSTRPDPYYFTYI